MKNAFARIFNRRIRVRQDDHPLYTKIYADRFRWMQLTDLKVSPAVFDRILQRRQIQDEFSIDMRRRLAVIIPFRNRTAHLETLIPRLVETLNRQQIEHRIIVVEQADNLPFNRAKLLNAGAELAGDAFDYYCFHDTDLLPVDCCYGCPSAPLRLHSVIHNAKGKRPVSNVNFSGVISLTREHFLAANGFSNEFWHWGKEDDNFLLRLLLAGIQPAIDALGTFHELDQSTDRYSETHKLRSNNRNRQKKAARGILNESDDGLSTLNYRMQDRVCSDTHELYRVAL
ncbi:MAG: hypothetical protein HKN56_09845 [Gammaproteobacteria bacterium]|nr:hypothetical protein [Gammaproteobacteria bacterium]